MDISRLLEYYYGINLVALDKHVTTLLLGAAVTSIHDRKSYGIVVEVRKTTILKTIYYGVMWSVKPKPHYEYTR